MSDPVAHGLLGVRKIIVSGKNDKLDVIVVLSDLPYQFKTGKPGHLYVGKDDIRIFIQNGVICLKSVPAYSYDLDVHTFPVDQRTYSFTYDLFIICN